MKILCYNGKKFTNEVPMAKKAAFTMIELVFVIVVLGVLAALALPRMDRDFRQEAVDNVIAALKYTQHMALNDNVIESNSSNWHRKFWRFGIQGCSDAGIFYYVGTDTDRGGNIDVSKGEAAVDTSNGMLMMGVNSAPCEDDLSGQVYSNGLAPSPNIFLTKKYGIADGTAGHNGNIISSGGCSGTSYIAFDYLGRPHKGITGVTTPNNATLLASDCKITLQFDDTSIADAVITVERETGRVYLSQ